VVGDLMIFLLVVKFRDRTPYMDFVNEKSFVSPTLTVAPEQAI
jgi:hypothetical protein